ncbi:MAG: TolB family protein [Gemmatimonadaceae bacterium]
MRFSIALVAMFGASVGAAQAAPPPSTDIYITQLVRTQGRLTTSAVRNLTRRAGYDNQPAFSPDNRTLYYTSNRGDGQTDIWSIDLTTNRHSQVTRTPESEYSAGVTPDRRALSVVRVERDSTQRLWRFPLGGGRPCLVIDRARPVGYYAFANDSMVAMFILGRPATLQIGNIDALRVDTVATAIGRSIHRIPATSRISFVDNTDSTQSWIRSLDPATRQHMPLAPLPPGVEDYAWTPRGELITSDGKGSIMVWQPNAAQPNYAIWRAIGTLDSTVAGKITRLAVSPNGRWLAIVAEPLR